MLRRSTRETAGARLLLSSISAFRYKFSRTEHLEGGLVTFAEFQFFGSFADLENPPLKKQDGAMLRRCPCLWPDPCVVSLLVMQSHVSAMKMHYCLWDTLEWFLLKLCQSTGRRRSCSSSSFAGSSPSVISSSQIGCGFMRPTKA